MGHFTAQEEDESCLPPDKKVEKILTKATNAPDAKAAVTSFNEAMELAPDNASITYQYAMYAFEMAKEYYKTYPQPDLGNRSMQKAEEMFEQTEEL